MDRTQLLQHIETLAETPNAVAKLRAIVLDLAARGRLVPQASKPDRDPAWQKFCAELDDPAESDGAIPPPPFDAPEHWRWAFLEEVAEPCGQKKPDARFTYVDVGAIDNVRGVITPTFRLWRPTKRHHEHENSFDPARLSIPQSGPIFATLP